MTRKLRKRPDGLSYKEVFSLNDEKTKEADKVEQSDATPKADISDTKPVHLRAVRSKQSDTSEPDRVDEAPEPEVNEPDLGEKTPTNEKATQTIEGATEPKAEVSKPEQPVDEPAELVNQAPVEPPARIGETSPPRKPKRVPAPSPEKSRLRGYIPFPALGVSPGFDAIHDAYGLKFATKHFLDTAIEGFVEAVRAGKGPTRSLRPDYPTMPAKTQATRHVPLDVVDHVREMIDPMGILAPGAFGTRVLEMAMVWHMKNDGKKD